MELVDVVDSKSTDGDIVPVRVRPPAPRKERPCWGRSFLLSKEDGLEPIAVELSGGQFLPPVQTLVATFVFAPWGKYATESGHSNCRAPQLGNEATAACGGGKGAE